MRTWRGFLPIAAAAALCLPATASADFVHVVAPGESLSSVAATDGLSVAALAAANGISPDTELIAGSSLSIPPQDTGAPDVAEPATVAAPEAAPEAPTATEPDGQSGGGAQPTPELVSASDVGSIAEQEGVPAALAEAVADQESGFNNGLVSGTGAAGVMQIEPGTWSYIGQNLAGPPPLSPTSASDNIRGGVLLLRSLLAQTGGDPAMAVAGYYQGLQSIRDHGVFADTQRYVDNVMALEQRFGG